MSDLKRQMARRLHSTKQWLTRAEESFDKDSTIRGELDLFLAQAELQHAREANCSRQWQQRYLMIRHALAFILATTLVAAGLGVYWWTGERPVAVPAQPVVQLAGNLPVVKTIPESVSATMLPVVAAQPAVYPADNAASSAPVAKTTPATQPTSAITAAQPQNAEQLYQTEQKSLLPPGDLQKIVQTAARSLRGQ